MAVVSQAISVYQAGYSGQWRVVGAPVQLTASSGTSIAVPSGSKKVRLTIRGTGGMTNTGFSTGLLARYNGDSGANYRWIYSDLATDIAVVAPSAASDASAPFNTAMMLANTGSAPATDVNLEAEFEVAVIAGTTRGYRSEMSSVGTAAATSYVGTYKGWWTNTAAVITTIDLIFGSAFTGSVLVEVLS